MVLCLFFTHTFHSNSDSTSHNNQQSMSIYTFLIKPESAIIIVLTIYCLLQKTLLLKTLLLKKGARYDQDFCKDACERRVH